LPIELLFPNMPRALLEESLLGRSLRLPGGQTRLDLLDETEMWERVSSSDRKLYCRSGRAEVLGTAVLLPVLAMGGGTCGNLEAFGVAICSS